MILGLGVPEMMVILLVVVIIFGPKNLPKLGSALGKTVKNVREGMEEEPDEAGAHAAATATQAEKPQATASIAEGQAAPASFCPHCGAPIPAQAAFCPRCGAAIAAPDAEASEEAAEVTAADRPSPQE